MKRNWIVAICLSLFAIAGLAASASAQQPTAAPDTKAPETKQSAPDTQPAQSAPGATDKSTDDKGSPAAPPPGARTEQPVQTPPGPSVIERQVETRSERVEREPARLFGLDPAVALIVGAVVLIVVVLGIVAMSRREEDPHRHTV